MNANRIIDMIVRQILRRLVNTGVNKGFDMASQMGRKMKPPASQQDDSGPSRGNTDNRG